jgi:phosphatidylethanolamine-binding protein (PEBP) family uncharacterized protein
VSRSSTPTARTEAASEKPSSPSSQGSSAPVVRQGATTGKQGSHVVVPKGPKEPEPTAEQRAQATLASIRLSSPALQGGQSASPLPATYTCDGKDTWPSLRWAGVPPGTAELALFAMNVEPVGEKLFFDWAVAGLDPGLGGLKTGVLPKGAVLGRNSFGKSGYSICPPGSEETYIFALYALPKALSLDRGFDPRTLRDEALRVSGNVGLLAASYARG